MLEAIYKGATRPAMKWGVPLMGLVGVMAPIALVTMWVGSLVSNWAFPIGFIAGAAAFFWMRFVTAKDDQRLAQRIQAIKLALINRNRRLFRFRSYGPYRSDGARDRWRR